MSKLFEFIARHGVISTVVFSILMILIGLGLLLRPRTVLLVLRYSFAIGNIGGGLYLLLRTLGRATQR